MSPLFRVVVDGSEDATQAIHRRLISLSVVDEPRRGSDTLEIVVDDALPRIESPRKGSELDIDLAFGGVLIPMGRFVVDESEVEGPPDRLVIKARAANMTAAKSRGSGLGFKVQRTRSWHETTLGAVLSDIALSAELPSETDSVVAAVAINHLDQLAESDASLLQRLRREHDLHIAVQGGVLVALPEQAGRSVKGKPFPVIEVCRADVTRYRMNRPERRHYAGVAVQWYDSSIATGQTVFSGSSTGSVYLHKHQYADEAEATRAAASMLRRINRAKGELELTLVGDPRIVSGTWLNLTGFRDGMNGRWSVKRAEHKLSGGIQTTIKAELAG